MTDLLGILPSFRTAPFAALLPTIEQHALTTTDLLALHPADIAKQTRLPLLDLRRFVAAITAALADDVVPETPLAAGRAEGPAVGGGGDGEENDGHEGAVEGERGAGPRPRPQDPPARLADATISTLDDDMDAALGGGVPVGRITEFAGESGAGKTQFLLALCLAVQLPPPRGLAKQALYISTESGLATRRLAQMLACHPLLAGGAGASLDRILSTATPDLESQDHILEFQVPVLLARHDVGLVVVDSVAANYRAEFERHGSRASNMAARGAELVRLGALLRRLARRHAVAVVVANQVADRFAPERGPAAAAAAALDSPLAPPRPTPSSSAVSLASSDDGPPALRLDHQQRWFTGWGDDPCASHALKTPSLGLVWSTQIACRVALLKRPDAARRARRAGEPDAAPARTAWRRWLKVVFAPHVAASGPGVDGATEFELTAAGPKAVNPTPGAAAAPRAR